MCRIVKELGAEDKVYGVLTDYDLSSWVASLNTGYSKTSQHRTGTPPYMAQELLLGTSDIHLYRHDMESLFYIMLLMCARHKFDHRKGAKWSVVMREGMLPYQKWFNQQDYDTLGALKETFFFSRNRAIDLSPDFEDFRPWLRDLLYSFSEGFKCKLANEEQALPEWRKKQAGRSMGQPKPTPVPFDEETLGGYVDYSAIIEPTRELEGDLKGLTIRYDLPSSPLPTGAAQVDT